MTHSASMVWQRHDSLEEAEPGWRKLQLAGSYRVFQDFDWVRTWFDQIGRAEGITPRIIIGSIAGTPRILFPLGLSNHGRIRRLSWLASEWNDYNAPIIANEAEALDSSDLWAMVLVTAGEADILEISKQAPVFGDGRVNSACAPESIREDNSTHVLDLHRDQASLRGSIHSARTWNGFERRLRKLAKAGELRFQEETDPDERRLVVAAMVKAKAADLVSAGKRNPFSSKGAAEFFTRVVVDCPHIARLFTLRLDGRPIATTLCLAEKETLLLYQLGYDREFGHASPGVQLLHHIIFKAAEEGYSAFDCLFGDDPYKLQICNRSVPLGRAFISLSTLGHASKYLTMGRLYITRKVKKSPVLFGAARGLNRIADTVTARG